MSYKFSKEELKELLVDYNEIALKDFNLPSKVCIWDETLRDGEQSPTVYLTLDEKIHLAKMMDEIGVKIIAVGFPAVSESEKKIVKTIVNEDCKKASIVGIARPKKEDIDACIDADLQEIVVFMPISPIFMKTLKLKKEDELSQISSAINYAKDNGFKVNWVSEDGTRAEFEHIKNVLQTAIKAGAERVVIGDTVGVLTPQSTSYLMKRIKKEVIQPLNKEIPIGIHTHNDFGLAVANTVTGVFEGCQYPHTCINGYGERAGNAALEEVATILERMGIDTGIDLTKLPELSAVAEEYFCQPISQYKPIVGDYAFSHESGLHIAAILAHPLTYEPINPKMVGRRREFYLGKFSGSKSIMHALKEKLKMLDLECIPDEIIKKIVTEVKQKHESKSKEEIRNSFHIIKNELNKITKGLTDKEFFNIVNKYAQPFVPKEFKPKDEK
ncbi:MAG: homoaconitate hydratase [Candidatus Lokiarchaeota archaeon]|nr:homoaconitate hydratase [Candidatus Lokiarchaeota archaeon]MBD3201707.1 homoaconitate hydratase [Candidatus Lokiarchaeota archaeon]